MDTAIKEEDMLQLITQKKSESNTATFTHSLTLPLAKVMQYIKLKICGCPYTHFDIFNPILQDLGK